jgi:hypothetical protein
MQSTLKVRTTVKPGHRVEFTAPELPDGSDVDVSVTFPDIQDSDALGARFRALASLWEEETAPLSSITQKAIHPAYQEIIGLGRDVLPLILRELQQRPAQWFWALRAITGENPVKPEQQGRVREMASAWVQWGLDHRVIV